LQLNIFAAAKILLFSGLTKDLARKREEKCQILKIGNFERAEKGVSFSPASRELLAARCGGGMNGENLKKRK